MGTRTLRESDLPDRKGAGVAEEEVQRVIDALEAVEAIEDPVREARAISETLADQRVRGPRMTERRREIVRELREAGGSIRGIAAEVGVSPSTVQDILRGHSGKWSERPKADET